MQEEYGSKPVWILLYYLIWSYEDRQMDDGKHRPRLLIDIIKYNYNQNLNNFSSKRGTYVLKQNVYCYYISEIHEIY